jgi:hypothetical protein
MRYYVSKTTDDLLIDHIEDNFQTYLDDISSVSGVSLDPLDSVKLGGSSAVDKIVRRPSILIEPVGEEINSKIAGSVESVLRYDVLIQAEGGQEEDALTNVGLYKDAFVSMIFSDDTLGGEVDDADVTSIERFAGGSAQIKNILLSVEITVSQGR